MCVCFLPFSPSSLLLKPSVIEMDHKEHPKFSLEFERICGTSLRSLAEWRRDRWQDARLFGAQLSVKPGSEVCFRGVGGASNTGSSCFFLYPPACFRETCFQKSLWALFSLVFSNHRARTRETLLLYLTLFPERDLFSVLSVTKTIPSRPGPVA